MSKKEFKCPECENNLRDVRDQDDRIDFWCDTCRTAFHQDWIIGKENEANMQSDRA